MSKVNIKTIRAAVTKHRGGLEEATDAQILRLWNQLTPAVQKQYLESLDERKPHAGRGGSQSDN